MAEVFKQGASRFRLEFGGHIQQHEGLESNVVAKDTYTGALAVEDQNISQNALKRHIFSATGTLITMDQLFHAAENISEEMTAYEAADDFCTFFLDNLREVEEKAGNKVELPR